MMWFQNDANFNQIIKYQKSIYREYKSKYIVDILINKQFNKTIYIYVRQNKNYAILHL